MRYRLLSILWLTAAPAASWAQERSVTLDEAIRLAERVQPDVVRASTAVRTAGAQRRNAWGAFMPKDRKSTRLNSSHMSISYAVFCLKKKKPNEATYQKRQKCQPATYLQEVLYQL